MSTPTSLSPLQLNHLQVPQLPANVGIQSVNVLSAIPKGTCCAMTRTVDVSDKISVRTVCHSSLTTTDPSAVIMEINIW